MMVWSATCFTKIYSINFIANVSFLKCTIWASVKFDWEHSMTFKGGTTNCFDFCKTWYKISAFNIKFLYNVQLDISWPDCLEKCVFLLVKCSCSEEGQWWKSLLGFPQYYELMNSIRHNFGYHKWHVWSCICRFCFFLLTNTSKLI